MANFAFSNNTLIYTESDGVVSVTVNLEGTADGFGVVFGTLIAEPVGAPSGTYKYVGASYPETARAPRRSVPVHGPRSTPIPGAPRGPPRSPTSTRRSRPRARSGCPPAVGPEPSAEGPDRRSPALRAGRT